MRSVGDRRRDAVTRRDWLKAAGVTAGAAVWPQLSAAGAPRLDDGRAVILLLLVGGPSQLETWDPKPDAPAAIRGPFSSIGTRTPGVRICEHLRETARRLDKIAIVRSLHHDEAPIHETGLQL